MFCESLVAYVAGCTIQTCMADTLTDVPADSSAAYGACIKLSLCTNSHSTIMLSAGLTYHRMLLVRYDRKPMCCSSHVPDMPSECVSVKSDTDTDILQQS